MQYGDSDRERVRAATNILDLFEATFPGLDVKHTGNSYQICCPFHQEKTPSCHIRPDRGTYKCFGCGEGGDVFQLVMAAHRVSFPEALEELAHRAHITLTRQKGPDTNQPRSALYTALEAATQFFEKNFPGSIAEDYIRSRGISRETSKHFRLGYTGNDRNSILSLANRVGIQPLVEAGLVNPGKESGHYGVFKDRVIFPIFDQFGRVVSFGGRTLVEDEAKYINGKETSLFKKLRILYGINEVRDSIRGTGLLYVVEGYVDVIRPWQEGIRNIVGTMGTSLTKDHVRMLTRMYPKAKIVLCFDGDAAGVRAAERASSLVLGLGNTDVCLLPKGEDPASMLEKELDLRSALQITQPVSTFYLDKKTKDRDLSTPEGMTATLDDLREDFARIPPTRRGIYIDLLAERLGHRIRPESLERFIEGEKLHNSRHQAEMRIAHELVTGDPGRQDFILEHTLRSNFRVPETRAVVEYFRRKRKEDGDYPLFATEQNPLFMGITRELQEEIRQYAIKEGIPINPQVLGTVFRDTNDSDLDFDRLESDIIIVREGDSLVRFHDRFRKRIAHGNIHIHNLSEHLRPLGEEDDS